jgi:hypothetical protein
MSRNEARRAAARAAQTPFPRARRPRCHPGLGRLPAEERAWVTTESSAEIAGNSRRKHRALLLQEAGEREGEAAAGRGGPGRGDAGTRGRESYLGAIARVCWSRELCGGEGL